MTSTTDNIFRHTFTLNEERERERKAYAIVTTYTNNERKNYCAGYTLSGVKSNKDPKIHRKPVRKKTELIFVHVI